MTDEYVPPAKQCILCETAAVDPSAATPLCETHREQATADTSDAPTTDDAADAAPDDESGHAHDLAHADADSSPWASVDWHTTASNTYPDTLLAREQWMGRLAGEKMPFAPWGDRDHPDADPDTDARYKWGLSENYVDGETVALAEDDPKLGGRVFLQQESDPFAFVDGDDVRDPASGDVHPGFVAILSRLGFTYADVSTSGAGVHAYYRGDLPGEQGQAVFQIDSEPWGENDDPPTVEVYANTHVNVTTGDHVADTPTDVREWDADAVEAVLREYDARKDDDAATVAHDTDRERDDLSDHDPTATTADETTTDVRDVVAAVDRLRPRDLNLRTRQVGTDATGWEKWDPSSYRTSSGGESLHKPPDEPVFHDFKHNESFGVLSLFAAEQGILSDPWDTLAGADWWDAVEAAREQGAPIPEYAGGRDDAAHTAVLPPSVRDLTTAASGWDWRHAAATTDDTLTMQDGHDRTTDAVADAYTSGDRVLIEALPTMGKSHGAVQAAADTGQPVTIVTGRGHKEQYAQYREWCEKFDLKPYTLPSFTKDCPTATGQFGDEWADTVRDWYRRGATPKEIHKAAEYVLGSPLPCQQNGTCPYAAKWDFDPDDYDVLIGHYNHTHKTKVTSGRVAVFDEFPDSFETQLGPQIQGAVSHWLQTTPDVPYSDYTDLLENRDDESRRADALLWFEDEGVEPDEQGVFDDPDAHAAAPLAAYTILAADDLGNGFEAANLPDTGHGVRNRRTDTVSLLRPPTLRYASGVVALDGTPTKEMWELALGTRLNHRPVLQDDERGEYIQDALNLNLVRTTEAVKPYNSADHVTPQQDAALLERVHDLHDEKPAVITSRTAEKEYEDTVAADHIESTAHYGNVKGSNRYKHKRVGAVVGSNHYGDDYLKKWAAFAGRSVERNDEKGAALSYGSFGDRVLRHMREHETLQAAMRFGRDGNGSVVYVHTNTLPDWVSLAGEGRVVTTWADGMQGVLDAIDDLGGGPTAEIAAHPAVDVGERQVFDHLETLRRRGVVAREQDDTDGRRVVWQDDGVHRVGENGDVELDTVAVDELDTDEVDDLARTTTYTCQFTNRPENGPDESGGTGATPDAPGTRSSETGVSGANAPD